jgi:NodT family efflux transporter outer membrane factor (OMF) lipoprotein
LRQRGLVAAVAAALAGSGCTSLSEYIHNGFKVGPNYCRPKAPLASEWIDYQDPRVKSEEQDLSEWWRTFNDPALNHLVETAYRQNLSVREAGARILASQARRGVAIGNLFPQLQQALGSYTRNQLSRETANVPPDIWFSNWEGGFVASWELDLWGRFRRAIEAADAELDASIENYDAVLVVLFSDIAAAYVEYRTFEQRLVYARQNVEIQTRAYELAVDKHKAGAATERDVQQARQILEQTRALIPVLERGQRQAGNRLCVLLGIPPIDLAAALGQGGGIPTSPPEVAVGIPADLLRRRPDVRRAERQVAAQSARIGVAEANFYPHLGVTGTIGVAAEDFDDLFNGKAMYGSVGPYFRWDILNYGRLYNRVLIQDARFQELGFAYQNSVLNAAREAEDAIVAFLKAQEQAKSLAASVAAAERTLKITNDQYQGGAIDFTPVFITQSVLAQQQDQLAVSRGDIALGLVGIYRALGGGWEMRLSREGAGRCGPGGPGAAAVPGPGPQAVPPVQPATPPPETLPPPSPLPGPPKPPMGAAGGGSNTWAIDAVSGPEPSAPAPLKEARPPLLLLD